MRAADPPVAGGRAPPMTVFVSDLFMENKRGTSAIKRFGERPRKETQKQPTRARTGTVGRSKRFSAPERESSHAHQVRQFQRIEKERVELRLEEQREQVELEQEQLQQEEISPAEAARASRCLTCKPAGVCPRAYAYARLSDVSDSRRRACRMEEPLDGSFDTFAKRRGCCRSRRVCAGTFAVLLCPPDTVPGDDSSEKEATQLSHVRGCRTVFCNVSLGGSCCSVRRCREGEQLREQAVKEVLTAATKPKLRRNTLHNPSAGNHRDDYEERPFRRGW